MKGDAVITTPNKAYGQIQQGGSKEEEETPRMRWSVGAFKAKSAEIKRLLDICECAAAADCCQVCT